MRTIICAAAAAGLFFTAGLKAETFAEMFPDIAAMDDADAKEYVDLQDDLTYQRGTVTIGNDLATLDLGEGYYFLGPQDSATVLTDLWGNPPGPPPLGMVLPAGYPPLDNQGWAMVLEYDPIGYVSDDDANAYDYNELLKDMQAETVAESAERVKQGYGSLRLVGWAEPPHYDTEERKLYWAKELEFNGDPDHALNYNIRALGRRGVLIMNVVGGMAQLSQIRSATPDLLAMTQFTEGNRYADYDPATDKAAAVGIGGLIAGGLLAKKTGLLAVALIFLKKFWFLIFLPLIWLKNLFTGRRSS